MKIIITCCQDDRILHNVSCQGNSRPCDRKSFWFLNLFATIFNIILCTGNYKTYPAPIIITTFRCYASPSSFDTGGSLLENTVYREVVVGCWWMSVLRGFIIWEDFYRWTVEAGFPSRDGAMLFHWSTLITLHISLTGCGFYLLFDLMSFVHDLDTVRDITYFVSLMA
jgi:hypothetical protein